MLTTLARTLKTALISLWRNRWLSLASTLVMIITLLIISIFVSLTIVTNKVTAAIKSKIDMAAYMEDTATDDQVFALRKVLLARSDVADVYYVSKKEALREWQERNKDNADLRDIITEEENPLPRSLEIKTKTPEDLDNIAKLLSSQDYAPLIKELSHTKSRDMINRLVRFANFIKISGWSLTVIFVLISILVIYNTIRLTIFARSEEIEIMKLVGATDWFVRGPFIFEGIAYGIAATIIASLLLYLGFAIVMPIARNYLGGFDLGGGYLGVSFALVVVIELAVGVLLGMLCSVLAVKKYLKQF
jgi:cell division transport system permease protein